MKKWTLYVLIGVTALSIVYIVFVVAAMILCVEYGIDFFCPNTPFAS